MDIKEKKEIRTIISQDEYNRKVEWLISIFRALETSRLWDDITTSRAIGCVYSIDAVVKGKVKIEPTTNGATIAVKS